MVVRKIDLTDKRKDEGRDARLKGGRYRSKEKAIVVAARRCATVLGENFRSGNDSARYSRMCRGPKRS